MKSCGLKIHFNKTNVHTAFEEVNNLMNQVMEPKRKITRLCLTFKSKNCYNINIMSQWGFLLVRVSWRTGLYRRRENRSVSDMTYSNSDGSLFSHRPEFSSNFARVFEHIISHTIKRVQLITHYLICTTKIMSDSVRLQVVQTGVLGLFVFDRNIVCS